MLGAVHVRPLAEQLVEQGGVLFVQQAAQQPVARDLVHNRAVIGHPERVAAGLAGFRRVGGVFRILDASARLIHDTLVFAVVDAGVPVIIARPREGLIRHLAGRIRRVGAFQAQPALQLVRRVLVDHDECGQRILERLQRSRIGGLGAHLRQHRLVIGAHFRVLWQRLVAEHRLERRQLKLVEHCVAVDVRRVEIRDTHGRKQQPAFIDQEGPCRTGRFAHDFGPRPRRKQGETKDRRKQRFP